MAAPGPDDHDLVHLRHVRLTGEQEPPDMAVSTPGSQEERSAASPAPDRPEAGADAAAGADGRGRRGLGPAFARMWAAQGISNVGDGVYVTALPLLAASLTRDPLPVSAVMFAQWLPWLLFGLVAGALLDRWERVRVMWTVDACRFAIVGGLAAAVLLGWASIPLLMAAGFLLGTGQTLVDTAAHTLVPALVSRDPRRLERANSRLLGTQVVADQLAGPPLGGALFSLAAWSPFLVDAVSFGLSSALMARLPGSARGRSHVGGPRTTIRADIAEGLRFLLHHRLLRAMAGLVMVVVIASSASDAILVLFAAEELGLGSLGFGLLLTGGAVGGVLGSAVATWCGRRLPAGRVVTVGFLLSAAAHLGIGLTSNAWVAGALLGLNAIAVIVFNVIFGSLRQQLAPDRLLGRVVAAFRLFSFGSVPTGALLGGIVARAYGLRAPFLAAGVAIALVALVSIPAINTRTIERARAEAMAAHAQEGAAAAGGPD